MVPSISFGFQHRSGLVVETTPASSLCPLILVETHQVCHIWHKPFLRSTAVICPGVAEEVVVELDSNKLRLVLHSEGTSATARSGRKVLLRDNHSHVLQTIDGCKPISEHFAKRLISKDLLHQSHKCSRVEASDGEQTSRCFSLFSRCCSKVYTNTKVTVTFDINTKFSRNGSTHVVVK